MLSFQLWQWLAVAAAALVPIAVFSAAILRMFPAADGAPAPDPATTAPATSAAATLRPSTPLESGFFAASAPAPPPGTAVFDVWSYRVQARYAGRARVVIAPGPAASAASAPAATVSIAGPRTGPTIYRAWIWLQTLTLALVPAALVAAAVRLDWRWLLVALGLLLLSTGIMGIGTGIWPGAGEVKLVAEQAFEATEFPATAIRDLGIGKWATDGMDVVLFHYKPMIDQLAKENAVTFTAPDGSGHQVRYALHCYTKEDAQALQAALRAKGAL